jgi:hypothetical protein
MLDTIWGWKTTALFDVWSFDHFLTGISLGSAVITVNHHRLKKFFSTIGSSIRKGEYKKIKGLFSKRKSHISHFDVIGILFLAYLWETIEHYLEAGLSWDRVTYWFQGVEFWANRLITDPGLLIIGYLVAKKFPRAVWPARIMIFIWLFVHIFIFEHCMVLHQVLFPSHTP